MGAPAPDSVKRLADCFDQNRKVFLSADYEEEQLLAAVEPEVCKAGGVYYTPFGFRSEVMRRQVAF